jgi:hypothetical protein
MEIIDSMKDGVPERCLIFSEIGVGKSTLANSAPKPIFLNLENKIGEIKAKTFQVPNSYEDLRNQLGFLLKGEHNFETVVLDTIDAMEALVFRHVCHINNIQHMSAVGYGVAYNQAETIIAKIIDGLNMLRDQRNMRIIALAHSHVKLYNNPLGADYDKIKIKLREKNAELFLERFDMVGYLHIPIYTSETEKGFGTKRTKGSGGQERVFSCYKTVSFVGKNSYGIDYDIDIPKIKGYNNILEAIEQGRKEQRQEEENAENNANNANKSTGEKE